MTEKPKIKEIISTLSNKSSCGVVLKVEKNISFKIGVYLGDVSNNVAEYYGAIYGLWLSALLGASKVVLRGDS